MDFSDKLWLFEFNEKELDSFVLPYIGNGFLGTSFEKLLISTWEERSPIVMSPYVYDGGRQLHIPSWSRLDINLDGVLYKWENGRHNLKHRLDLRSGLASLKDRWEYKEGKTALIEIELLIPRSFLMDSLLKVRISAGDAFSVRAGLDGRHLKEDYSMKFSASENFINGAYLTAKEKNPLNQLLAWTYSGNLAIEKLCGEADAQVLFKGSGEFETVLRHQLSKDGRISEFLSLPLSEIYRRNQEAWMDIWKTSMQFEEFSDERRKIVNAFQFYLYCSVNDDATSLAPLGLSEAGWNGAQFWDTDFWMFRAILPVKPEFAAARIRYRHKCITEARKYAEKNGLKGLWYCWKTDDLGRPVAKPEYENEIHLSAWVALSVLDYRKATGDEEFYRKYGIDIIRGIAEAFYSRGAFEADGKFHFRNILGPDEALHEIHHRYCDDNFLTNYAVAVIFRAAAKEGGSPDLIRAADKMFLSEAGSDGIIPEHYGYAGEPIKQADLILAFYPLGFNPGKEIMLKNMRYYRSKIMEYGPFMTASIESCIMMRNGMREEGIENLFEALKGFLRGPHNVLCESRTNSKRIFLTGIGGFLQALHYGLKEPEF